MVVAGHAPVVADRFVEVGDAVFIFVVQAGDLGALDDEDGAFVFDHGSEWFVEAGCELGPDFGGVVVDHDLTAVEGGDEMAVGSDIHAADLRVDAGRRDDVFEGVVILPGECLGGKGEGEEQAEKFHGRTKLFLGVSNREAVLSGESEDRGEGAGSGCFEVDEFVVSLD